MNGGNYSIAGGFWELSPRYKRPEPRCWPSAAPAQTPWRLLAVAFTGFTLQQNTNGIATVNWSNVVTTPNDKRDDQDGHCESAKRE